jgi:hypothetical protein
VARQLRNRWDAAAVTRHMRDHDTHFGGFLDPDNCDDCYVISEGWMRDIHAAVFAADADRALVARLWAMQDGYGEAGVTPEQGFDWSGIRDSTPATIEAMWREVRA